MNYLIKNVFIVNEGAITSGDVLIKNGRIHKIAPQINNGLLRAIEIDGTGLHLLPGCIDDQVHFREPGLTHKANIYTESKAAIAGGVTSFMEMPNTIPNALTAQLLEDKYEIAKRTSLANYSFYMGVSNDNVEEVLKMNGRNDICGVKIFMGSSTGNMLVDNPKVLETIFRDSNKLIATHCEDEATIKSNYAHYKKEDRDLVARHHPLIRSEQACFISSRLATDLAKRYNSRLHVLHISTAIETSFFGNEVPVRDKRITAEVCVHHLHFTAQDYEKLGYQIKCNPAIKAPHHKEALWQALLDDRLDVIATDHAPHLMEEKIGEYEKVASGVPLVQTALPLMLHYYKQDKISLPRIVQKMSHAVADCFVIKERGYIREGYWADLVLVDLNTPKILKKEDILYKCGWSPFEGFEFPSQVTHTFVNGDLVYENGQFYEQNKNAQRLLFS